MIAEPFTRNYIKKTKLTETVDLNEKVTIIKKTMH